MLVISVATAYASRRGTNMNVVARMINKTETAICVMPNRVMPIGLALVTILLLIDYTY
jgi:hypothetical protein